MAISLKVMNNPARAALIWGAVLLMTALNTILANAAHQAANLELSSAIYDQALWNLSQGHGLNSSMAALPNFAPLLVVYTPLYWLGAGMPVIFLAQNFIVALGVIPLSRLADHLFDNQPSAGPIFAMIYALFPLPVGLEPGLLALPALLLVLEGAERRKRMALLAGALLALLAREDMAIPVMAIGAYLYYWKRQTHVGIGLALAAGLYYAAAVTWFGAALPSFALNQGNSLSDLLSHPISLLSDAASSEISGQLILLLAGVAFLPLLNLPTIFLLSLSMVVPFLNTHGESRLFNGTPQLVGFVFLYMGALFGARTLHGLCTGRRLALANWIPPMIIPCTFIVLLLKATSPGPYPGKATPFEKIRSAIPAGASLSAPARYAPRLSRRKELILTHHLKPIHLLTPIKHTSLHLIDVRYDKGRRYDLLHRMGYTPLSRQGPLLLLTQGRKPNEPLPLWLTASLKSGGEAEIRAIAARELGRRIEVRALGALFRAAGDPHAIVRKAVVRALGRIAHAQVKGVLKRLADDVEPGVRHLAIAALACLAEKLPIPARRKCIDAIRD